VNSFVLQAYGAAHAGLVEDPLLHPFPLVSVEVNRGMHQSCGRSPVVPPAVDLDMILEFQAPSSLNPVFLLHGCLSLRFSFIDPLINPDGLPERAFPNKARNVLQLEGPSIGVNVALWIEKSPLGNRPCNQASFLSKIVVSSFLCLSSFELVQGKNAFPCVQTESVVQPPAMFLYHDPVYGDAGVPVMELRISGRIFHAEVGAY